VEHQWTQGWQGSRQVAMPGEASGDARLPSAGGVLKASQAPPGQFRFALKPLQQEQEKPRFWLGTTTQIQAKFC